MLKFRVGTSGDTIENIDQYFDAVYEREWFQDPMVREMVRDIDKSEVLEGGVIDSPVLGIISPANLSRGVKTLILMLFLPENEYYGGCGDNCAPWMLKIAEKQDVTVALPRIPRFRPPEEATVPGLNLMCVSNGQTFDTMREFVLFFLREIHELRRRESESE